MDQSVFSDAILKLLGIASIPIIIALIIFCLWLYFNIGTLTRLTDIKYKLDEVIDAINDNSNPIVESDKSINESIESKRETIADASTTTEQVELKHINYPSADEIKLQLVALKKPSKAFMIIIVSSFIVSGLIIAVTLIVNR